MKEDIFKNFTTIELSKFYAQYSELFYMPYLYPTERKENYEFRKKILNTLLERLEEEYNNLTEENIDNIHIL